MKNQFVTFFAAAMVLFLLSCGGNPVESPEYQQMLSDYQAGIQANTALQAAHVALQDEGKELLSKVAALQGDGLDSLKNALTTSIQALSNQHGKKMQAHASTINAHAETVKGHTMGEATMESIKADFEKIKSEQQAISDDYATMKAEHNGLKGQIEAAMAAVLPKDE